MQPLAASLAFALQSRIPFVSCEVQTQRTTSQPVPFHVPFVLDMVVTNFKRGARCNLPGGC